MREYVRARACVRSDPGPRTEVATRHLRRSAGPAEAALAGGGVCTWWRRRPWRSENNPDAGAASRSPAAGDTNAIADDLIRLWRR